MPKDMHHAAQRILADLDRELAPANREWVSARIVTLLAHYWMPDMPVKLSEAVMGDWIRILGDLPRHAVEAGCQAYLQSETRARPTPGQVRKLALIGVEGKIRDRDRLAQCLDMKQSEQRGGVKRLGAVTRKQALQAAAEAKAHLRAAIAEENAALKAKRKEMQAMPATED